MSERFPCQKKRISYEPWCFSSPEAQQAAQAGQRGKHERKMGALGWLKSDALPADAAFNPIKSNLIKRALTNSPRPPT